MTDTLTKRVTAARETIDGRAFDGIEQVRVPFKWLTVSPTDSGYEVRGALSLQAVPRAEGFREAFAPGTFDSAIVSRDQRNVAREAYDISAFLFSNSSLLLGSTQSNTLSLVEHEHEVSYLLTVSAEPHGEQLAAALASADHGPCVCIHMRVSEDEWSADSDGSALRTIKSMTLFSVEPEVRPQISRKRACPC